MNEGLLAAVTFAVTLVSLSSVSATNGCFSGDPECGPTPTDNCDITQSTTFTSGT